MWISLVRICSYSDFHVFHCFYPIHVYFEFYSLCCLSCFLVGSEFGFQFFHFKLQELKANQHKKAKGTVIEAGLDKSKGPIATFIVQNGTLRKGDVLVCGEAFGKVCV